MDNSLLIRLLELSRAYTGWTDILEDAGCELKMDLQSPIFDIVLDALGVPPTNDTAELVFDDSGNPVGPDGYFCRDAITDVLAEADRKGEDFLPALDKIRAVVADPNEMEAWRFPNCYHITGIDEEEEEE